MFRQLLEETQEPLMDKELWLSFITLLVLQRILLEIFMLEIIVQSEWSIQQVWMKFDIK